MSQSISVFNQIKVTKYWDGCAGSLREIEENIWFEW